MSKYNGLTVYVARTNGADTTAGGISSRHDRLTVVGTIREGRAVKPLPSRAQIFPPTELAPAVALRLGGLNTVNIVPVTEQADGTYRESDGWHMAGGNYGAYSDSRLREAVEGLLGHGFYGAVAIHDRVES